MAKLSAAEAQLPAFMVESIFYGIYLITFFVCLQGLLWDSKGNWKPFRNINILMIGVVLLLFLSSSTNLALALVRSMQFFVYDMKSDKKGHERPGEIWLNVLKSATAILQTIIADSILVYRCWLIWNKSFLVVFGPFLCWLGAVACGTTLLYYQWIFESTSGVSVSKIFVVSAVYWSCTIAVNIYSTSLIIWRIWKMQQGWRPPSICSIRDIPQRSRFQFAQRIFVESGILYTTVTIIVFISYTCQSASVFITTAAEIQITGIAFNLILMRAATGPYPEPMDTIPMSRGTDGVSSEGLEAPSLVDAGVVVTEDRGSSCIKP